MYVKGNPVLSKMFAHCGLTLNEKGLFYSIPEDTKFEVLITEDHVKIAEIMGFDYVEFEAAKTTEDFFKLLFVNPFFRPSRFLTDTTEGKVKLFKELAEHLAANPVRKGYTVRQVTDMFEPLKEFGFEDKYNDLHSLRKNQALIHRKFNGGTVLKLVPGYDKRNLEVGIQKFNHDHFPSQLDRMRFILNHTEKEIVEEYLRATDEHVRNVRGEILGKEFRIV